MDAGGQGIHDESDIRRWNGHSSRPVRLSFRDEVKLIRKQFFPDMDPDDLFATDGDEYAS